MEQLSIKKAQKTGDKKVIATQITISEEIEDSLPSGNWREEWDAKYKYEASLLFRGLKQSLPQGTMHQLLILMLQDKQNLMMGI